MKLSSKGFELIKKYEGFSEKPYMCSAGYPTIGYGNRYYVNGLEVTMHDASISKNEAVYLLSFIVDDFSEDVTNLLNTPVSQNQFDALVSFAYNLGMGSLKSSTLLKKVNADPNDATIPQEFVKWIKAGGKSLRGLAKRRTEEAHIFINGYEN
jgi:lysozyme